MTPAENAALRAQRDQEDRQWAAQGNQGFEGAIRAQGGQAAVESFWRNLQDFLEYMEARSKSVSIDV